MYEKFMQIHKKKKTLVHCDYLKLVSFSQVTFWIRVSPLQAQERRKTPTERGRTTRKEAFFPKWQPTS